METIIKKSAYETVAEQFITYGKYVNRHRHVPYVFDGLKPSYRRTIQAAFDVAKDKLAKVATISGHCIGHYHPHGDQSINPVVSQLVNAKIFEGQGNHGAEVLYGEDQLPAAPRYIEAKLSESYKKLLLPVLKFVPTFTNDLGNKEYEYLPTPIPFGLTFGYLGIAVGTGCRIPAFTPSSILDAYLHDDPKLLKSAFGLEIANPENLHHLWETGRGRIKYDMKVEQKGNIVSIIGSKGPVEIDWSWFEKMKADGRIEINDLSDTVPRVELELNSRVRYPSVSEVYNNAVAVATAAESYYVRVVYNNQVRDIGLRDWIDITYKNYIRIYELHRKSEISALEYDIKVLTNFRSVADKIINTKDSYEQIANDLKIDLDIVKTIGSKSINTLRNSDPTKKIPELKNRIESIKKVNVDDVIKNCIELMS